MCLHVSVLVLAATSCGPAENDTVFDVTYNPCERLVVEPAHELRPAERDAIEGAVSMWNDAAALGLRGPNRRDQNLEDQDLGDQPASTTMRIPVRFEPAAGFVNGYYDDEAGEVIINRNLTGARERTITLAHELGHAFGLRHVAPQKRRSLMNAGNLDTEVTQRDIEVLRKRWQGCPTRQ
jgi:hypothetical protein